VNPRDGQLNNISGRPLVELMIYDKYESAGPCSFRNKSFEKGIFETSFWLHFTKFWYGTTKSKDHFVQFFENPVNGF